MEPGDHEWELSKENVQPLKQGRHMSALVAALHSDQGHGDELIEIRTRQSEFEMDLRTKSGDELFDVWDRYIKWTEQYYPKGGHEGKLLKLIEQCLKLYQNDPKYANDERFIQIWLKFANLTEDPVEVFKYMFDIGVGAAVSQMYVEWATALERNGDLKRADAIYAEGLNRCTHNKDLLKQSLLQFQSRVAQKITLQVKEDRSSSMFGREEKESRAALSRLKTHGSSHKVGVTRTGAGSVGFAGTYKSSQAAPLSQKPVKSFEIFQDENAASGLQPLKTEEYQSLPVKAATNRENEKKPGVWRGAKEKQKPVLAPVAQPLPFEIFEDECPPEDHLAPKTKLFNSQPLSSSKATSNPGVLDTLRQGNFVPNTGTPMYQKDKVYNGVEEFSFEELRANRYWRLRKEREDQKREVERNQREEWVLKQLEHHQATIAELQAALAETRLRGASGKNESGHTGSFHTPTDQLLHSSGQSFSAENSERFKRPNMMDTSNSRYQAFSNTSQQNSFQALSQNSALQEGASAAPLQVSGQVRSSTPMEDDVDGAPQHSQLPKPSNIPHKVSEITPNNSHLANVSAVTGSSGRPGEGAAAEQSTPLSFASDGKERVLSSASVSQDLELQYQKRQALSTSASSTNPTPKKFNVDRQPISAPSPTVYTKEAMQDILGMFNCTISDGVDSFTGLMSSNKTPSKSLELPAHKQAELQVFEDVMETEVPAVPKASFIVHEDTAEQVKMNKSRGDENVNIPLPKHLACQLKPLNALRSGDLANSKDENTCQTHRSRGSASTRKIGLATAKPMDFEIFQDNLPEEKPQDSSNIEKVKPVLQKPFEIYYQELQDESTCPARKSVKQSARRGIAFSSTPGGKVPRLATEDMDTLQLSFTTEFQAKTDQTLAPLDHFTHHAMIASTPYTATQKPTAQEQALETSNGLTAAASSTSATSITSSLASTLGAIPATPSKNLSPIMEGSDEGSNFDTKSMHSTAASHSDVMLRSRHASSHSQVPESVPEEAMDDNNVSMHDKQQQQQQKPSHFNRDGDLDQSCHHQIDTTAYFPDEEQEEATQALLSASVCIDPKDPFDEATIKHFLSLLNPPIESYPNYERCKTTLPMCEPDFPFNNSLTFDKCIGEGGYAKVWKVCKFPDTIDTSCILGIEQLDKALKIQKSGGQWEFYISSVLPQRLRKLKKPVDMSSAILVIDRAYFFDDGTALEMEYLAGGSLLNLVNAYKQNSVLKEGTESFACLLTIQLLHLFEQMHACQIIHGDVKPDNFLVAGFPGTPDEHFYFKKPLVKLIDFGQSIDMTMFPPGTTFSAKIQTSGFQCIEMKTNRPWTFQTDLFGLAGTIHVALFGSYMNVFQEHGEWRTTGNFVRKWNTTLWKRLFKELLNVPSCWQMPDLAALRQEFESHFQQKLKASYVSWVRRLQLELNSSSHVGNS